MSYIDNPASVLDLVRDGEVHRDVYTDPDVFALEMKHVFRNTWIYVGHASQVLNHGDYLTTTIADQPVFMVRHTDDSIRVLYNRCAHRGVEILRELHGNVGRSIICPYHAWAYKTDGSILGIPDQKQGYENTGFDQSSAIRGLSPVAAVHVYREFVFARLEENGIGFEEFFGESLSSLDNMVDRAPEGRLEVVGSPLRYMHNCNWKMLIENQTDTYHPMIVHKSSAGAARDLWEETGPHEGPAPMAVEVLVPFTYEYDVYRKMGIRIWPNGHGHTGVNFSTHSEYTEDDSYFTSLRDAYGEDRAKEILATNRHNTVYFPNLMVKGPIQKIRLFKPLAADKTVIESWIFRLVGAPDYLLERTAMYNRLINAPTSLVGPDDLEMYERAQQGMRSENNEWVNIQREDFGGEGQSASEEYPGTTEAQMRNQFRAWKTFMSTVAGQPALAATGTDG